LSDVDIILSLDVVSLFTNIPLPIFLDILKENLEQLTFSPSQIKEIISLTNTLLSNNSFQFNNSFYEQIDGCPMGSNISPIVAEIFLKYFELNKLNTYYLQPKFYTRYVDDIFIVWQHGMNDLHIFIEYLNNIYPSIKFKLELMENNKLNFLDYTVIRNKNNLTLKPYYKDTHTGMYIHKSSFHPISQKIGLYHNMFYKLFHLKLENNSLVIEKNKIFNFANNAGFSTSFMEKIYKKCLSNYNLKQITTLKNNVLPKKYISLHYTDELKNLTLSNNNAIFSYKPPPTIGKRLLPFLKDKIPKSKKPGIYNIKCCEDSCTAQYVGQTKRSLTTRATEHERDMRLEKTFSKFLPHASMTGHKINFTNISPLDSYDDPISANIKESYYIKKFKEDGILLLNDEEGPWDLSEYFR
jgi:hypothetical protein